MKIVVGVVAGSIGSEQAFLKSYWNCIEPSDHTISLIVVSGSLSSEEKSAREASCRRLHAEFLSSEAAPARQIFDYAKNKEADICFLFPQGVCLFTPGLLTRTIYFFERNQNVGLVAFKPINSRGFHDHSEHWMEAPIVIEEVEGPFAMRLETVGQVGNMDIDFDSQLLALGYPSFCLPWPPVLNTAPLPTYSVSRKINRLVMWLDKLGQERSAEL